MADEMDNLKDDDALAAELVLGLLEGDDKAAALRKQLADPKFAQAVAEWGQRVDPLYQEFVPHEPPSSVWTAIESRLDAQETPASHPPDETVVALKRWRSGAIISGALAACLALALIVGPTPNVAPSQPNAVAVAQLTGEIDGLVLAVSYNPDTAEMRVDVDGMPETETEPELWIVGRDGVPRSLGQIGRQGISAMTVPSEQRSLINAAAILQLSMEPPSETPHAIPSGKPVASGKITII
ncbi:MAG: anti-sigma factor [Parasphingorhabdus sp.]|uniref:anti-sigma factor n=1 Tax=Parasphingorhabdus sp. TaxID=2709688 RepID=UPI00329A6C55